MSNSLAWHQGSLPQKAPELPLWVTDGLPYKDSLQINLIFCILNKPNVLLSLVENVHFSPFLLAQLKPQIS